MKDRVSLERALRRARPGTRILLAPGLYGNGLRLLGLRGAKGRPIVLQAKDPLHPPLFRGGKVGIHLSSCAQLVLRHLKVQGCSQNGINADDGGRLEEPSEGLVFEGLEIEGIGPRGNRDGLKLSGLDGFLVRDCRFFGWGGSAIDMVGCHRGVVRGCRFVGRKGFSAASGVQLKGGSEDVRVEGNLFRDAGLRAVNLGGSTDRAYFRPRPRPFEARNILVQGNTFFGSLCPIVFASSRECIVRENTITLPRKWVLRILQEQPVPPFQPCQRGRFEKNLVLFDDQVKTVANIGPHTKAKSFVFFGNAWFHQGGKRRIRLPSPEKLGIYQIDPKLAPLPSGHLKCRSQNPRLQNLGAHAWRRRVQTARPLPKGRK